MKKAVRFTGELAASVVTRIKGDIAKGVLLPGQFISSERDLARELGISRVTVRRGLDQLVQSDVLRREASRGYALRAQVSSDVSNAVAGSIVCVHAHSEEKFVGSSRHARIWAGAREEAVLSGHFIFISSIPEADLTPRRAAELARVAGGVLCDCPNREYVRALVEAGIPAVQMDYHRQAGLSMDAVVQDDAGGITLAVEYLYAHGHRRIGYMDSTRQYQATGRGLNAEQRLAGFKAATGELGIAAECTIQPFAGNAPETVARFLENGVTALVLPHIDFWPEIQAELAHRGITLPSDFGLVAWGLEPTPGQTGPCPSSITWSREQMGREAVRRLLIRMRGEKADPATIVIPCQMIDRGTGGRGPFAKRTEALNLTVGSEVAAIQS